MNEILQIGQTVYTNASRIACTVERFLGGGGQGEVYQANLNGQPIALKWYFPHYLQYDLSLRDRLDMAISSGAPSDRFLWPLELTSIPGIAGFGYIMPIRRSDFVGIIDLMKCRTTPTFRSLCTVGFELADSFFQLHARGLCYRDISFGNVFFNPDTGNVLICDNDNVDVDHGGATGILGTPRFMAPEIVRGDARPSTATDLFSLAVMLFYIFMMHHPLEGQREAEVKCFDLPAMTRLYGTEPIFIYDPNDDRNRPVAGYQDNAIVFWKLYPAFLQHRFIQAFTDGLAPNKRVQETEWRSTMIQLRDSILYCSRCGAENFYDVEWLKAQGKAKPCWNCNHDVQLPPRIRFGKQLVMLNHNTQLFPHHVDDYRRFDFSTPIATVTQHPTNPSIWGLKNLSAQKWVSTTIDGTVKDVPPDRSVTLASGTKINFGTAEGEIRYS